MSDSYGATIGERVGDSLGPYAQAIRSLAHALRVALPATVISFDATKQTVTAQPALTDYIRKNGVITPLEHAILKDVPVVLPRAGNFTLTMPIKAGDECLLVFADTCIDAWWQSGGVQNQAEQRRHSLSDAFAICGIWNQTRPLAGYSTSSSQLRSDDGTVTVDVAASKITLTAPTVAISASSEIDLTAPTVKIAGSTAVQVSGGHTSVDGKTFLTHDHSGVTSGGSNTGPVV